jgi:hypothetical protein
MRLAQLTAKTYLCVLCEIKKSYITIDSNVKLCYTYETGGGYFYGRLLG